MRIDQIALQLYTVREQTAKDFIGTLRELARIGYRAVEFAGYGGVPVAEMRAALDELGLRAIGAHVPYDHIDTRFREVVSELHTLGCEHAIVPWLRPEMRTPDHIEGLVERFNRWAAACQAEGLRFGYHNHDFEFAQAGGGSGGTFFDALIERTDPALVGFELDAYWAIYAGVDPIDLLRRHGARIPLLHVKDMGAGPERADVPVGAGTIAWRPILEAATAAGIEWYVVEQDNPGDALADVTASLRGMEAIVAG